MGRAAPTRLREGQESSPSPRVASAALAWTAAFVGWASWVVVVAVAVAVAVAVVVVVVVVVVVLLLVVVVVRLGGGSVASF